jgi:hypothetical protein
MAPCLDLGRKRHSGIVANFSTGACPAEEPPRLPRDALRGSWSFIMHGQDGPKLGRVG